MPIVASVTKHAATLETPDAVAPGLDAALLRGARRRIAARRSSTSRSTRGVATSSTTVAAPSARSPVCPTSARSRSSSTARDARCSWSVATCTGRGAEAEVLRVRRGRPHPRLRERHGARRRPGRPRARVLACPVGGVQGSRPGDRGRHAARLPARLRVVRRRRSSTSSTARTGSRRTSGSRPRWRATSPRCSPQLAEQSGRTDDGWVAKLRDEEQAKRATEQERLTSDAAPIDPARVYGELRDRLDRDAIVIGDGGDFVSYMGKYVDTYTPGCFLGPGPYGCLGSGTGLRAGRRARASRPAGGRLLRRRRHRLHARRPRHARASRA